MISSPPIVWQQAQNYKSWNLYVLSIYQGNVSAFPFLPVYSWIQNSIFSQTHQNVTSRIRAPNRSTIQALCVWSNMLEIFKQSVLPH